MPFQSTKTYGHELGLSCAFRQWRAKSHCSLIHGYALSFKFVFECDELDETNWCVDFGAMKSLKGILEDTFDHTLLVAEDDPMKEHILKLGELGLARIVEVPSAGCEASAKMVYEVTEQWLKDAGYGQRVRLMSVEVSEHGANSALFVRPVNVA